ncbi:hypothetical protein [Pseudaminobacter soli (ex Li et al. 2025)]|uniref:Uncharacterized protein n=1 Tax=Pseudaminobacter soli (ex Li et al. 2025) TaxID=1295366 RepID=A0A2P7SE39_9HYPH|nr:hypothetical protein [Mesorhizobium soli]PSJ60733.1 hypothetical protein C7I85_11865 [Mesorhizobium soli]
MSDTTDTRDRVIRLEAEVAHQTKTIEAMDTKVTEMHDLLMAAKGARWAIIAAASVGGFIAAKLSFFFPWFPSK